MTLRSAATSSTWYDFFLLSFKYVFKADFYNRKHRSLNVSCLVKAGDLGFLVHLGF